MWLTIPARKSSILVTISHFSKTELLRYVSCPPERVRVIGVPVGAEFRADVAPFRCDKPIILQIGTRDNKNLERVVKALASVSCRMLIVGALTTGQQQLLLDCQIEYENRVGLTSAEIVEAYRCSDMVIFASTYEGFGMPIIEANVTGRPVITSNICSMPEVAGDAACLVDPLDVESIREGVLQVINDAKYREQLIQNGFRNARRYMPELIAQQYAELYRELSKGKSCRKRQLR
jgi:glycosyltransferase involved in cell wall biosynthesis